MQLQLSRGCSALLLLSLSAACTTSRGEANDFVDQGVQAVDRSTRTQLAIDQADPGLDPSMLAGYSSQFEEGAAASAAQFAAMRQRIEEQERLLGDVVRRLASGALESVPGLSSLASIAGAVGRGLRGSDERNARRAEEVEAQDQCNADEARERNAAALARAEAAARAAREVEARLEGRLREAVAALSSETREKLATQQGDLAGLRAAVGDDARFERELERHLRAAGLSPEEIQAFKASTKDFSSREILELLAALAAGLGGGATASRLGKSRNADKVEKLEQDNEELRRSMTRMNFEVARAVPGVHLGQPPV